MLHYFYINTCIVTTVSGVKQHSYAACDPGHAASLYINLDEKKIKIKQLF